MSFQAYLDNVEKQTGKTPQEIVELAKQKGFTAETKSGDIITWLKTDLSIGHGHAMALTHVIKKGPVISEKHVGKDGAHGDVSTTLRLDGIANRDK